MVGALAFGGVIFTVGILPCKKSQTQALICLPYLFGTIFFKTFFFNMILDSQFIVCTFFVKSWSSTTSKNCQIAFSVIEGLLRQLKRISDKKGRKSKLFFRLSPFDLGFYKFSNVCLHRQNLQHFNTLLCLEL